MVLADDDMFAAAEADYARSDTLLLGRRTYETFAASWPQRGSEVPHADWLNNTRKYVVSTTLKSPEWTNTTVIEGDLGEAVARLNLNPPIGEAVGRVVTCECPCGAGELGLGQSDLTGSEGASDRCKHPTACPRCSMTRT